MPQSESLQQSLAVHAELVGGEGDVAKPEVLNSLKAVGAVALKELREGGSSETEQAVTASTLIKAYDQVRELDAAGRLKPPLTERQQRSLEDARDAFGTWLPLDETRRTEPTAEKGETTRSK